MWDKNWKVWKLLDTQTQIRTVKFAYKTYSKFVKFIIFKIYTIITETFVKNH